MGTSWELTLRCLTDDFMNDLKQGILSGVLLMVQRDHTLDLEIRNEYINIYYRGGNIIKIDGDNFRYQFEFNKNYFCSSEVITLPGKVTTSSDVDKWVSSVPVLKREMDTFLANPEGVSGANKSEREFQQLLVRDNNYSRVSNSTDYFIADIEYTDSENRNMQFDLVGIKWPSWPLNARKLQNFTPNLAIMEMKYSYDALKGSAGITKHIEDLTKFMETSESLERLKRVTIKQFKQKRELGLVLFGDKGNSYEVHTLSSEVVEYIILLANYPPESTSLRSFVDLLNRVAGVEVKIATSNFFGYGLFKECMYKPEEFFDKFAMQMDAKGQRIVQASQSQSGKQ